MIVRLGPGIGRRELLAVAFHDYPLDDARVACVVPVGTPGAAAVISREGALRTLHVDEHGASLHERVDDVVADIAAGELAPIHPAAPGMSCSWLQSRRVIRHDLGLRAHQQLRMVSGDALVIAGAWLSGQERAIAVQVEDTSRYDAGGLVLGRVEVFDLGGPQGRRGMAPMPRARPAGQGWAAGNDVVAIARDGGLTVYDAGLFAAPNHPLTRASRTAVIEAGAREVHAVRLHPSAPVAVLAICTAEVMGMRDFALYRLTWSEAGAAEVRPLAQLHAVGDVGFGAFAPGGDAVDVRVRTGDVDWLMLATPSALLDLGPARGLQEAVWSGPRRFLAFERATAQIAVWSLPEAEA